MHARNKDIIDGINNSNRNPSYLTEFELNKNISAMSDISQLLGLDPDMIILSIPAQEVSSNVLILLIIIDYSSYFNLTNIQTPNWLRTYKDFINPKTVICNTAKGLYLKDSCLLSDAVKDALQRDQPYVLLSGPSFAKEIMLGYPTAGA
jgi:glycerol-3-phosphate dehydrogenase